MNLFLVLALAALGLLIAGLIGWRQENRRRAERQANQALRQAAQLAKPPEGALEVSTAAAIAARPADQSGRIMLVLAGSFAANVGTGLLTLLERCGLAGAIGSILVIELDRRRREHFLSSAPAVFHDRLVPVRYTGLAGGLGNRSPQEVRDYVHRWGPEVARGATTACERHQALQRGDEPALVLTFVSQGGQALLGVQAVDAIARQFPLAKFFGLTALPVDDRLRVRTEYILDAYRRVGVHGFVVSDNLCDEVRNDFGLVAAITGFAAAAEHTDAAVEQNNAWYHLFTEAPGGLVSFSTYARNIPGYVLTPTHPLVAPRFYVFKGSVRSAIETGLEEVRRKEYHALAGNGLAGQEPLTSRFDIVLAAVRPADLRDDADDVVLGQELKGRDKRNYHLQFAPIMAQISVDQPLCPVAVVSLHAVHEAPATLQQLTAPVTAPQVPLGSSNGLPRPNRSLHDA
jgi:hypothetical protein